MTLRLSPVIGAEIRPAVVTGAGNGAVAVESGSVATKTLHTMTMVKLFAQIARTNEQR